MPGSSMWNEEMRKPRCGDESELDGWLVVASNAWPKMLAS